MFEKISDFHNTKFENLWGGFSCECLVDDINKIVSFYKDGKEVIYLNGSEAEDVLDFVLSEYYENEDTVIEDGFSTWLMGHYDNRVPSSDKTNTVNEDNLDALYSMVVKEHNKQKKIIKNQKMEIKRLKQMLEKSSKVNFELRRELEEIKGDIL